MYICKDRIRNSENSELCFHYNASHSNTHDTCRCKNHQFSEKNYLQLQVLIMNTELNNNSYQLALLKVKGQHCQESCYNDNLFGCFKMLVHFLTISGGVYRVSFITKSKLPGFMIIFPSSRREGFPIGFMIPVNVIVNMTWGFIHHTAPNPWICLDSLFEFCFLHLAHSKCSLKVRKKLQPFLTTHQPPNENSNKSHHMTQHHFCCCHCYTMPNN